MIFCKMNEATIKNQAFSLCRTTLTNDSLNDHQILNLLPVAIYVSDINGNIIQYNEKAAQLLDIKTGSGNQDENYLDTPRLFASDGSFIPHHASPMAQSMLDGLPRENEILFLERPGLTRILTRFNIIPLKDEKGNITGLINCFYEINEWDNPMPGNAGIHLQEFKELKESKAALKESENKFHQLMLTLEKRVEEKTADLKHKNEELRKSEERYHKMIEEVEDYAIILLDKHGIIQNWNKGAEKIKGYKEEEIVGKSFKIFYSKKDQESGLATSLLDHAKKYGKAIHEGWRMRKDGSKFWGSIVITALHDNEDKIMGFSKVTRDLTERKLAEDKLKEYTSELEFQNKELEQFAYAASHDMKEPLRKIHFYNAYIEDTSSDKLDEKSRIYLSRSLSAVNRMNTLIEDLLTYSRTTSNTENFTDTDLNKIVEEVKMLHKEEIDQKKVMIKVDSLPTVKAVPFQIKQLMENLVNNSIKYKHPARHAELNIESELVKGEEIKEIKVLPNRLYHKISITDNGIGFEPQHAGKIFEIFQRLNNHPGASGSGIGLAICNRIVQNHKGYIKATGQLNEGARFDVYLPADN